MKISKIRNIALTFTFIMIFIVPLLNLIGIYFIKGTFISFDIGELAIADPVMIFQAAFAGRSFPANAIVAILIPIFIVLIFGRVWCSFACPYTFILDNLEKLPFLKKRFQALHAKAATDETRKKAGYTRIISLILFFILVGISGVPLLHLFSPPAVLSSQGLTLVKTFTLTVEITFIIILLVIEIFFSYRFYCRYLCPTGNCLSLMQNKKSMHVTYVGNCIQCKACIKSCPMCINPMLDGQDKLCNNCGKCIDICPDKSKPLKYKLF